jgi:hypothetical protein
MKPTSSGTRPVEVCVCGQMTDTTGVVHGRCAACTARPNLLAAAKPNTASTPRCHCQCKCVTLVQLPEWTNPSTTSKEIMCKQCTLGKCNQFSNEFHHRRQCACGIYAKYALPGHAAMWCAACAHKHGGVHVETGVAPSKAVCQCLCNCRSQVLLSQWVDLTAPLTCKHCADGQCDQPRDRSGNHAVCACGRYASYALPGDTSPSWCAACAHKHGGVHIETGLAPTRAVCHCPCNCKYHVALSQWVDLTAPLTCKHCADGQCDQPRDRSGNHAVCACGITARFGLPGGTSPSWCAACAHKHGGVRVETGLAPTRAVCQCLCKCRSQVLLSQWVDLTAPLTCKHCADGQCDQPRHRSSNHAVCACGTNARYALPGDTSPSWCAACAHKHGGVRVETGVAPTRAVCQCLCNCRSQVLLSQWVDLTAPLTCKHCADGQCDQPRHRSGNQPACACGTNARFGLPGDTSPSWCAACAHKHGGVHIETGLAPTKAGCQCPCNCRSQVLLSQWVDLTAPLTCKHCADGQCDQPRDRSGNHAVCACGRYASYALPGDTSPSWCAACAHKHGGVRVETGLAPTRAVCHCPCNCKYHVALSQWVDRTAPLTCKHCFARKCNRLGDGEVTKKSLCACGITAKYALPGSRGKWCACCAHIRGAGVHIVTNKKPSKGRCRCDCKCTYQVPFLEWTDLSLPLKCKQCTDGKCDQPRERSCIQLVCACGRYASYALPGDTSPLWCAACAHKHGGVHIETGKAPSKAGCQCDCKCKSYVQLSPWVDLTAPLTCKHCTERNCDQARDRSGAHPVCACGTTARYALPGHTSPSWCAACAHNRGGVHIETGLAPTKAVCHCPCKCSGWVLLADSVGISVPIKCKHCTDGKCDQPRDRNGNHPVCACGTIARFAPPGDASRLWCAACAHKHGGVHIETGLAPTRAVCHCPCKCSGWVLLADSVDISVPVKCKHCTDGKCNQPKAGTGSRSSCACGLTAKYALPGHPGPIWCSGCAHKHGGVHITTGKAPVTASCQCDCQCSGQAQLSNWSDYSLPVKCTSCAARECVDVPDQSGGMCACGRYASYALPGKRSKVWCAACAYINGGVDVRTGAPPVVASCRCSCKCKSRARLCEQSDMSVPVKCKRCIAGGCHLDGPVSDNKHQPQEHCPRKPKATIEGPGCDSSTGTRVLLASRDRQQPAGSIVDPADTSTDRRVAGPLSQPGLLLPGSGSTRQDALPMQVTTTAASPSRQTHYSLRFIVQSKLRTSWQSHEMPSLAGSVAHSAPTCQ